VTDAELLATQGDLLSATTIRTENLERLLVEATMLLSNSTTADAFKKRVRKFLEIGDEYTWAEVLSGLKSR